MPEERTQSLREVLAADNELRHKVQRAAAHAAHQIIKEAGVKITTADVADAQSDVAAMTIPASELGLPPGPMDDTVGAVVVGVAIGALTGF